jgi:hypothetical protein
MAVRKRLKRNKSRKIIYGRTPAMRSERATKAPAGKTNDAILIIAEE